MNRSLADEFVQLDHPGFYLGQHVPVGVCPLPVNPEEGLSCALGFLKLFTESLRLQDGVYECEPIFKTGRQEGPAQARKLCPGSSVIANQKTPPLLAVCGKMGTNRQYILRPGIRYELFGMHFEEFL